MDSYVLVLLGPDDKPQGVANLYSGQLIQKPNKHMKERQTQFKMEPLIVKI